MPLSWPTSIPRPDEYAHSTVHLELRGGTLKSLPSGIRVPSYSRTVTEISASQHRTYGSTRVYRTDDGKGAPEFYRLSGTFGAFNSFPGETRAQAAEIEGWVETAVKLWTDGWFLPLNPPGFARFPIDESSRLASADIRLVPASIYFIYVGNEGLNTLNAPVVST